MSSSKRVLTARASLQDILLALGRVGWGPMQGREWGASRAILEMLSLMMREQRADFDACLITTATQLSDRTGYSVRHVRRCLQWMEDAHVIEWKRGGIDKGKPCASVIRVVKKTLVEWVRAWRARHDAKVAERNRATAARIDRYRLNRIRPRAPKEVHADMMAGLTPLQGRAGNRSALPRGFVTPNPKTKVAKSREIMAQIKARTREKLNMLPPEYLPMVCSHGKAKPRKCNQCQFIGLQKFQADEKERQRLAEERRAKARAFKEKQRKDREAFENADRARRWGLLVAYVKEHYPRVDTSSYAEVTRVATADPQANWILVNG